MKEGPGGEAGAFKETSQSRDQGAIDAPILSQSTNQARRGSRKRPELRQSRGGSSRRGLDVESLTRQAHQCAHDLVLGHRNDLATGSAYGREHFTYARRFRRCYALRDGWGDGCWHEILHPCPERRVVGRAVGSLHAKQTGHPGNLAAAQELGESAVAPKHVGAIADREHDVVRCAETRLLP